MKTTTITTISLKTAAFLASCFAMSAQGGTTAATTATPSTGLLPVESLGMEASIGYDSRYYFRGLWFSNDNIWSSISASVPVNEKTTFEIFGYYTDSASNLNYSELDLGGSLAYDAGFATFSVGYTWFYFFNGFFGNDVGQLWAHEAFLSGTVPLGPVNLTAMYAYDFYVDASYAQLVLDSSYKVNEWLSIVPSATVGYGIDDYYSAGTASSDFTHIGLNLAFPVKLTESATLTPYVAANFSMDARENVNTIEGDDEMFGGVSLAITF